MTHRNNWWPKSGNKRKRSAREKLCQGRKMVRRWPIWNCEKDESEMGTREDKDGKKMKRGWEQEKTKTGKWRNETGIGNVQRVETKGVGQTERSFRITIWAFCLSDTLCFLSPFGNSTIPRQPTARSVGQCMGRADVPLRLSTPHQAADHCSQLP